MYLFQFNHQNFYSARNEDLYRIRFSELYSMLNVLQFSVNSLKEKKIELNKEDLMEQINVIHEWSKALQNNPEVYHRKSEDLYKTLLKEFRIRELNDLKLAYFYSVGIGRKTIYGIKRMNDDEIKRREIKLKKKLGLNEKNHLSYFLSRFYQK